MIPSISQYKNRYYRCRSTPGGATPCQSVGVPAFEVEQFVRSMICAEFEERMVAQNDRLKRSLAAWNKLDESSQLQRITDVVHQLVFDVDHGVIEAIIHDDFPGKLTDNDQQP